MSTPLTATKNVVYPDFGVYMTYAESIKSATAIRKGITNVPTTEQYKNMASTYQHIILPLFNHFGRLPVSSFFRSAALNRAVGGAANSAHLYGQAVDIDCDALRGVTNRMVFDWARTDLDLDQLILESPDQFGNPQWVHLAFRSKETNRHQALKMIRVGSRSTYQII